MRREHTLGGTTRRKMIARGAALLVLPAVISSRGVAQDKMSKEQASYQETPEGDQRCGNCAHFDAAENTCAVVEGDISPQAWCRLWTQA